MAKGTDIDQWVTEAFDESARRASSPNLKSSGADGPAKAPHQGRKRPSLLDGPATRRALEQAEKAERMAKGAWAVLETPPDGAVAKTSGDADAWKLLETPPDERGAVSAPNGQIDPTQPEASWKVVATRDPKRPPPAQATPVRREQKSAPSMDKASVMATARKAAPKAKPGSIPRASQVPRPGGGPPARARMATLMGVQAAELPKSPGAATRKPPALRVPGTANQTPAAHAGERNLELAATMLGGPPLPLATDAAASTRVAAPPKANPTRGFALPAPAAGGARRPPPARAHAATMMGVAPPALFDSSAASRDTKTTERDPALAATMLTSNGPPPPPARPATSARSPQQSFADTLLAGEPGRRSTVPPLPQVLPTPAQLAAVPAPLGPQRSVAREAPASAAPALPAAQVLSTEIAVPAAGALEAQLANSPAPMREDSASEPSLSGLARNSVPPKRSLLRSPWLLAAAGLAVLAVPVTVVALMRGHGAAAERANGNPPSEVSKLEAAEARRERAGKSAAPRQSNPAASPAGKHAPPKPVATKAKAAKAKPIATEVATNREADKGPKATEREPAEIPWLDIEPVTTKQCKDLVEAPAGAGAYRFSQALETAQRSMVRGQVDAAHDAFCEASLLSEPAPAVLTGLAQVLLVKSDLRGALAAAEQLVAISPTSATAHNLRGDILIRMGKVDAAKLAWTRAAKATTFSQILRSNIARASHQAAKLAMRGGDLARADRMLRRALAMDPSDVIAAAKLAMVLHKNGKDKAARLWLGYAESLDPSHAQVRRVAAALS